MSRTYSGPDAAALRKDLAALITLGLVPYNIAEKGGELLKLKIVAGRVHADDDADEDEREAAEAKALTEVLGEAVIRDRIPARRHRRILKYILPLTDAYRGRTIKERRIAAGEHIADGKRVVKPGTIRTYYGYEPGAIEELARALVEMEAEYRGEELPSGTAASA